MSRFTHSSKRPNHSNLPPFDGATSAADLEFRGGGGGEGPQAVDDPAELGGLGQGASFFHGSLHGCLFLTGSLHDGLILPVRTRSKHAIGLVPAPKSVQIPASHGKPQVEGRRRAPSGRMPTSRRNEGESPGRQGSNGAKAASFHPGGPVRRRGADLVAINGLDFRYEGIPATLPAGPAILSFTNAGTVDHEFGMVKIKAGVSAEEAIAKAKADPEDESFVERFIGAAYAKQGEHTDLSVKLEPGLYGYACFVEEGTDSPHVQHGMIGTFTVAG